MSPDNKARMQQPGADTHEADEMGFGQRFFDEGRAGLKSIRVPIEFTNSVHFSH